MAPKPGGPAAPAKGGPNALRQFNKAWEKWVEKPAEELGKKLGEARPLPKDFLKNWPKLAEVCKTCIKGTAEAKWDEEALLTALVKTPLREAIDKGIEAFTDAKEVMEKAEEEAKKKEEEAKKKEEEAKAKEEEAKKKEEEAKAKGGEP